MTTCSHTFREIRSPKVIDVQHDSEVFSHKITVGPGEEVEAFCSNLRNASRLNRVSFIDNVFPPSSTSIEGVVLPLPVKIDEIKREIHWLRAEKINSTIVDPDQHKHLSCSLFNDPQPFDIKQGHAGTNCWLIAPLGAIAEWPYLLKKLFTTGNLNEMGLYEVRLCVHGRWETIIVDDFFPSYEEGWCFVECKKKQLWAAIIEKAAAKFYGSYADLHASFSYVGLSILTGATVSKIIFSDWKADDVWQKILNAKQSKHVIVANTNISRDESQRTGLAEHHAYSVLNVIQLGTERVVLLYNNYCNNHGIASTFISGDFNWGSLNWTTERRAEAGGDRWWNKIGSFWIPFEKFHRLFYACDIAHVDTDTSTHQIRLPVRVGYSGSGDTEKPGSMNKNTAVYLTLAAHASISVAAHSTSRAHPNDLDPTDLLILVCRLSSSSGKEVPSEIVMNSPRTVDEFIETQTQQLAAGKYVAVVQSFANFDTGIKSTVNMVIRSSSKIEVSSKDISESNMHKSLVLFLLKEGTVEPDWQSDNTTVRHFAGRGMIVMAENRSKENLLTRLDGYSEQFKSTRCLSTVVDSIPSCNGQIILVMTPKNKQALYLSDTTFKAKLSKDKEFGDFFPEEARSTHQPLLGTPHLCTGTQRCMHGPGQYSLHKTFPL